jgi:hypothetical protein
MGLDLRGTEGDSECMDSAPLHEIFRYELDRIEDAGQNPVYFLTNECDWKRSTVYAWREHEQRCNLPALAIQQLAKRFGAFRTLRALCHRAGRLCVAPPSAKRSTTNPSPLIRKHTRMLLSLIKATEDGRWTAGEYESFARCCREAMEVIEGARLQAEYELAHQQDDTPNVRRLHDAV